MPDDEELTAQPRVTLGFTAAERRALRILAAERGYPSLSAMLKGHALTDLQESRKNGFKH